VKKKKAKRTLLQRVVNVFLYIGIGVLVILLLGFGFSQTSTFRNYLKNLIVEKVNLSTPGELKIGELDGTLFTSILLKNTVFTLGKDTILNSEYISVKTSPLHLLFKTIYFRDIGIKNASINLTEDENGELNISKLFKSSSPPDTTPFPFAIKAENLQLTGVNFSLMKEGIHDYSTNSDTLNLSDLKLKNISLGLSCEADMEKKNYALTIDKLSAETNIKNFDLKNVRGNFLLNRNGIAVEDFYLQTSNSELKLNSTFTNYDIFKKNSELSNAKTDLNISSDSVAFSDISTFVPKIKFLNGKVRSEIKFSGKFSDIKLQTLKLDYDSTRLYAHGSIKNLENPKEMFINTDFYDSYIKFSDIKKIMPSLNIADYKDIKTIYFDSLSYKGTPLNFDAKAFLRSPFGRINITSNFDFVPKVAKYKILFSTDSLNMQPFAGLQSSLNFHGFVQGQGFNLNQLSDTLKLSGKALNVNNYKIDSLDLTASARTKILNYEFALASDTSKASFNGDIDFSKNQLPVYSLEGKVNKLNLAPILKKNNYNSDLNFEVKLNGSSFDSDSLNLGLGFYVFNSVFNKEPIDSLKALLTLAFNKQNVKLINLSSNILDINITGDTFSKEVINLLRDEVLITSSSVKERMSKVFPSAFAGAENEIGKTKIDEIKLENNIYVNYKVKFKNFKLLTLFLNKSHFEIDGDLDGKINTNPDSINLSVTSSIPYIKYWNDSTVFFLSNLEIKSNFAKSLGTESFNDISLGLNTNCDQIFVGKYINNAALSFELNNGKSKLNLSGEYEDNTSLHLAGESEIGQDSIKLNLDTLEFAYKKLFLSNKEPIIADISESKVNFENFNLSNGKASLEIAGDLLKSGNQKLTLKINNLSGDVLSEDLLGMRAINALYANINFQVVVTGNYPNPVINSNLNIADITFKNKQLGNLVSSFSINNDLLETDLKFIEKGNSPDKPSLIIKGDVPVKLSKRDTTDLDAKQINLTINANHFNLEAFGNTLPYLSELKGELSANLKVIGTGKQFNPAGTLAIRNVSFIFTKNDLKYKGFLKAELEPNLLKLDTLLIANADPGMPAYRKLTLWGTADMNNLDIISSSFEANGNLQVLGFNSRSVSPSVYGQLVLATNGNLQFKMNKNGAFLEAPITVAETNLIFSPSQKAYSSNLNNYIYKFASDTSQNNGESFENLIKMSKANENNNKSGIPKINFNYRVKVNVRSGAKVVFILSKELNQSLTAILSGNFEYSNINGKTNFGGKLDLLDGSNLDFFKTFSAEGSVRFENELDNPYMDITATYTNYFYPATTEANGTGSSSESQSSSSKSGSTNEELVAVKIKLQGPLKDLSKNFIQNKQNVTIYVGENNINNNIPSPVYNDAPLTNAIVFIALGKFPNTESGTSQGPLESTSNSLAGSLLGGFLNSYLGDYVRSVQLRKVGNTTKINLSGKVKEFRYSIGGSTDVFSDLSQTNIKIEYPITNSLLIRLERKESIGEFSTNNEMIDELGLKYKFEF
jgi:hypothetical protein